MGTAKEDPAVVYVIVPPAVYPNAELPVNEYALEDAVKSKMLNRAL